MVASLFLQHSKNAASCHRLSETTTWSFASLPWLLLRPLLLCRKSIKKSCPYRSKKSSFRGNSSGFVERISTVKSESWTAGREPASGERRRRSVNSGWVRRSFWKELQKCFPGYPILTGSGTFAQAPEDILQFLHCPDSTPQQTIREFVELMRMMFQGENELRVEEHQTLCSPIIKVENVQLDSSDRNAGRSRHTPMRDLVTG